MLYAIHDALVRPYPGQKMGPSLAQSWEESEDGLTYKFKLRPGLKFHNGDPVTTEDVKFSFERYQGTAAKTLKDHVREVEIVDPLVVRFHLKEPWPDFMTFYGTTASAAGIVVPKKYLTEVGDDGFKKHPIGAGPYKFVSSKPGIEVVLEAFPGYWRRVPSVKTLVMRSVPDATTRALILKTGEADIAYALDGIAAEGIKNDPSSRSWRPSTPRSSGSSSPSSGTRNRRGTTSGCGSRPITRSTARGSTRRGASASARRPGSSFPGSWISRCRSSRCPTIRQKPSSCSPKPAIRTGFDAGEFAAIPGFPTVAESVMNYLNAAGIRVRLKQMERAAFYADWQAKKLRGVFMTGAGNSGNAASRVEAFIQSKGAYAYGGYPDIDELFQTAGGERDRKKREAILDKIQQLTIDRVMYAPVMDLRALMGIGPRVTKHTITDVWMSPFPSYEDMEIKG